VQAFFHSVWLRHSCICPACWNVSTNQNLVTPPDLFGHPTIHSIEVCGERQLSVTLYLNQLYHQLHKICCGCLSITLTSIPGLSTHKYIVVIQPSINSVVAFPSLVQFALVYIYLSIELNLVPHAWLLNVTGVCCFWPQ